MFNSINPCSETHTSEETLGGRIEHTWPKHWAALATTPGQQFKGTSVVTFCDKISKIAIPLYY